MNRKSKVFRTANRDRNESEITSLLSRLQIPYSLMPATAGFDILVMVSPMECWEIKNPAVRWTLTKAEHERQKHCKRIGIPYRVIETVEQAVEAINERM